MSLIRFHHGNGIVTEPLKFGGYLAFYEDGRFAFGWGFYRDAAVNDLKTRTKPGVLQSSEVEHWRRMPPTPASTDRRCAHERPSQDLNDSELSAPNHD